VPEASVTVLDAELLEVEVLARVAAVAAFQELSDDAVGRAACDAARVSGGSGEDLMHPL
jgi:hypothetical protein